MGLCGSRNDTIDSIRKVDLKNGQYQIIRNQSRIIDIDYQRIPNKFKRQKEKLNTEINDVQGLIGLQNLGNTCFMNAAIQSLSHTQPLVDYILSNLHQIEINMDNPLSSDGVGINQFAKLINQLWCEKKYKQQTVQPIEFLNCLQKLAPQFCKGTQEDSHEFLAYLLDLIHEDLNRVKQKPYIEEKEYDKNPTQEQADESWRNYLKRNRSVIVDLFQGQQKSVLICQKCQYQSHRFEPFMYLSLPVQEESNQIQQQQQFSIQDCINEYCREEKLEIDEKWFCPRCKMLQDSIKKIDLWTMPNLLIIHLKRFKFTRDKRCKLRTFIDFPIRQLNFENLTHGQQNGLPTYDLYSVINHEGTLARGHYFSYALNRDDLQWYQFNDSLVKQISEKEVVSSDAYLLFYYKNSVEEFMRQTLSQDIWDQKRKNISPSPNIKSRRSIETKKQMREQQGRYKKIIRTIIQFRFCAIPKLFILVQSR